MRAVLITGVTGFVGTSLVSHFSAAGIRVFGHTRTPELASERFSGSPLIILRNVDQSVINENRIDTIIHLAGIAHDLKRRFKPEDYFEVNDKATRALFNTFLSSDASKFIYISSIKAVTDVALEPIEEDAVPFPTTPYGISKRQAEDYILDAAKSTSKQYYILRPCMIHGPGNKGNLNLLYKFVKSGLPYPLGDFHNKRSFLNISNFNFILESLVTRDIPSGIYHLADDGALSTREVVKLIAVALGRKSRVWNIPAPIMEFGLSAIGKKKMLRKLTEDMLVSNEKIKAVIAEPLPVTIHDGIINTIRSFNGK